MTQRYDYGREDVLDVFDTPTRSLKERARILALRVERERRNRIRQSTLVVAAGRTTEQLDVRDLMDGYLSAADLTAPADESPEGYRAGLMRSLRAHRQDEPFLIRDGHRRKATTYTDKRFPSGRVRNKANRLKVGLERLDALESAHGGLPEPMPELGFLPSPPRDSLAHGRSAATMRYRAACESIPRGRIIGMKLDGGDWFLFDTVTGQAVESE
jgi:hypothetical protein